MKRNALNSMRKSSDGFRMEHILEAARLSFLNKYMPTLKKEKYQVHKVVRNW